ncbi:hypothetical protein AAKU58_003942 [Oxalobacteraceae bacterium GrIS 1.18]
MYVTLKKGLPVLVDAAPGTTLNECSIVFPTDPATKQIMAQADARIWITAKDGEQYLKKVPFRVTSDTE